MKIINLTPHDIVLTNGLVSITFPPSGNVARIESGFEKSTVVYEVGDGIQIKLPVSYNSEAKIANLPKPTEGIYYIVSNYVAQLARRGDLLAPNTSANSAERDENGMVVSIKEFQQYVEGVIE